MEKKQTIGVVGSGAMGSGIAQVAATAGHEVVLYDQQPAALQKAMTTLKSLLDRLSEKGKLTSEKAGEIFSRIKTVDTPEGFAGCSMVIEAIVENLDIKKQLFAKVEGILGEKAVLATNTSSLSIASIGSGCKRPERVIGVHFFNPAPLMPLVEIIPSLLTDAAVLEQTRQLIDQWGKTTVLAKDTPGFIVNRVARPFYGEAIRMYEEGIADVATIDWAMKEIGGFRMGPFELMDYIGNDVNYTVTETVFREFFYDPRYKPSFTQKRLSEAGLLGRKTGKGYYNYAEGAQHPEPVKDRELGKYIFERILVMLINEAVDALYLNIASSRDLDLAMTKGVNYPKGLLAWADELGLENCLKKLEELQAGYGEDRYRPSPLLKRKVREKTNFY